MTKINSSYGEIFLTIETGGQVLAKAIKQQITFKLKRGPLQQGSLYLVRSNGRIDGVDYESS